MAPGRRRPGRRRPRRARRRATDVDDVAVGVLQHGVARAAAWPAATAPGRGPAGGRGRRRPGRGAWRRRAAGAVAQRRRPRRRARRRSVRGSASAGRDRSAARPLPARGRAAGDARRGAGRGRTVDAAAAPRRRRARRSLAASVGVEARTSATRSSSGVSGSWPIAETTGVRGRVHGPDQRLVGERQQVLDRAAAAGDHDHVDVGVAVEAVERPRSPRARRAGPAWRRTPISNRDARASGAARSRATSRSAAELGRGDQADAAGQERQRPLAARGEQALGGEQLAAPLEPGQQLAEADHADLAGVPARGCRGWRRRTGLAWTTTLAPSTSGGSSASNSGAGAGHRDRDVGDRVAQGQEDGVHARAAG